MCDEIMRRMDSGMPKLHVVCKALHLRREHPEWFGAEAAYTPMAAQGSKSDHLIAYLRGDSVAVFVPRWPLKLGGNWATTSLELPPGKWKTSSQVKR
jgi:(1->4)-alpha-D-glucan 1-alpha-D-glucosylmutase